MGIAGKARTFGSWTKNFGLSNAIWVAKNEQREKKYADLNDKNLGEIQELVNVLKNEYELKLEDGAKADDRLYEYTALELVYKKVDVLPDLIYFDELDNERMFRFKPDFAPDTLECADYIGSNVLVKKGPNSNNKVFHASRVLITNSSPCNRPTADQLLQLKKDLNDITENPLVSILIPNKDSVDILKRCLDSINEKSTYKNIEIVIAENNSTEAETFEYYKTCGARVETLITDWNFAHIMNEGRKFCKGEYIILLNNDTEVIAEDWIEQMLHFALKDEVGAVGAKLLFEDGTIQHAGVTFGIRGVAGHAFYGWNSENPGYENRICLPQNVTVLTAACLMVRASVFDEVLGFDENLKVNYNDVDFCLKIREAGYRLVYTPFAKLTHYESKTRGNDNIDPKKLENQIRESRYFQKKWCRRIFEGDEYYNRHLALDNDNFTYRNKE